MKNKKLSKSVELSLTFEEKLIKYPSRCDGNAARYNYEG